MLLFSAPGKPNIPNRERLIEEMNSDDPVRVLIRARLWDIPGDREQRVYRLGRDFCIQNLRRELNIKITPEGYDAMHFLPRFDSCDDLTTWFIYDFNVTSSLNTEELLNIPHQVYHATRQDDSW
jgi:hypothetical protein